MGKKIIGQIILGSVTGILLSLISFKELILIHLFLIMFIIIFLMC